MNFTKPKVMRLLSLLAWCLLVCTVSTSAQNAVTFRVDMSEYTGTYVYSGVFVNGGFNGWCGGCAPMSDANGDGVWELTIDLAAGAHEYKFTLDGWNGQEQFAGGEPCTTTNFGFTNRLVNVSGPVTLDAVCWNTCATCDAPAPVPQQVTFNVDMSTYDAGFGTVNLNGSFNGWCGSCATMTDADGDDVYSITLTLAPGTYQYKFTTDGWNDQESLVPGSECTSTMDGFTNRSVVVADAPIDLTDVCWESCATCTDPNSIPVPVTLSVDMAGYGGTFGFVNASGSFNGWCGDCWQLTDGDGDGVYTLSTTLLPGTYEYKFTLDNWSQENFTPGAACTSTIGGYTNRTLTVTPGSTTIPEVCWNSCSACPSGVVGCMDASAQNYNAAATIASGMCQYLVTFRVDMAATAASSAGVYLAGGFQGWTANATPMAYQGFDVYGITLALTEGVQEFKYINGGAWGGDENFGGAACASQYGNRTVNVSANTVLDVVCFNSCTACAGCTDPFSLEFNPFAAEDDGSCATALVFGCTYVDASNYNEAANVENGSCTFELGNACPGDLNDDGVVGTPDLLVFLAAFGTDCP
jgi:rhodanese-related sulfurtransferase